MRTDPLHLYLPPGTPFYIRSYCNEPIGGQIPIRGNAKGAFYEGSNIGYSNYTFATGNGSATTFSGTLPTTPVVAKSVVFAVPGYANTTDNGSGGCAAGNGVSSCSINYTTGAYSIVTATAVANGSPISGWYIGGPANGDQTEAQSLSNFSTSFNNSDNPLVGPISVEYLGPIKSIAVFGDSIDEGVGNSTGYTDLSYLDYASNGYFGVVKMPINGLQLASDADIRGRLGRISAAAGVVDRVIDDAGTNDLYDGGSLSQVINSFIPAARALGAAAPAQGQSLWWITMLPRVVSAASNTPATPGSGPYTTTGAGFGPAAVVGPTPLGGPYGSGALGAGVLSCLIAGNGTTGPYACTFPGATMIGSLVVGRRLHHCRRHRRGRLGRDDPVRVAACDGNAHAIERRRIVDLHECVAERSEGQSLRLRERPERAQRLELFPLQLCASDGSHRRRDGRGGVH